MTTVSAAIVEPAFFQHSVGNALADEAARSGKREVTAVRKPQFSNVHSGQDESHLLSFPIPRYRTGKAFYKNKGLRFLFLEVA